MRLDAAPQRPFGGDTDWIRRDLQCADVEAVEMRLPGGLIGEPPRLMGGQLMDDGPSQGTAAHIVQRRFVDDIVCVPGAQQSEEVQPALARPGGEPGDIVIADLRAEAVLAGMASTETQAAVCRPARSTSRFSSRNPSCPAISRRITCRFEMATPIPRSCATSRGTVTWP